MTHDDEITEPDEYPAMRAISGAFFFNATLVYEGPPAPVELVSIKMPEHDDTELLRNSVSGFVMQHGWQWEGGPWRPAFTLDDLPEPLGWVERLPKDADVVLLPEYSDDLYERYSTLFHLLPLELVKKFDLPVRQRGMWPRSGHSIVSTLPRAQKSQLSRALATYLWPLMTQRSGMNAFTDSDPIKLLAHDLDFWLAPMELVIREMMADAPRSASKEPVAKEIEESTSDLPPFVRIAAPRMGGELWTGEDEAHEVALRLIDVADESGNLRGIIDAVRRNRVDDDFSSKWSYEREDFERKLYKKRSKIRVSFVELDDTIPCIGPGSDIDGAIVWRDLLAVVDQKDRHVVVCLRKGHTRLVEIAEELGYANHSPVSKSLARIRERAIKLLH